MALRLYNVRTRQKEPFTPRDPSRLGFYLCGLTVYDHAHLGHARTAVSFEVIRRWLERSWPVRFVQNVTDVDDKILDRARELGVSPRAHAATWDARCQAVMARLGVRPPDEAPHVSDSVPEIVQYIEGILAQGFAYVTDAGNVYFDVPGYDAWASERFPGLGYGSLSRRDYREMAAGTRKDVEADKRHPADFALWKAAKEGDHPDASWDSPWSKGRPGWHIECSLMSTRSLGFPIDIHGGGQDLIFPHHENEIAQSQAKERDAPFVRVWMHTGFLNVEGEKMSKSLGNFIMLEQKLDEMEAAGVDPAALRLYIAQTHYRSKIDFSGHGLQEAARALERLERTRRLLHEAQRASASPSAPDAPTDASDKALATATVAFCEQFTAAMDDDLHTPNALAALFTFQRACNTALEGPLGPGAAADALAALEEMGQVLTLFDRPVADSGAAPPSPALAAAVRGLGLDVDGGLESDVMTFALAAREEARRDRDFQRADAIRDALAAAGYVVEDTPRGPRWSRA